MKTQLEIFKAARKRIEKEENWTQNASAKDEKGLVCRFDSAVKFCALGALWAEEELSGVTYKEDLNGKVLRDLIGGSSMAMWNDTHTHAEVLALYDKAIAKLEADALNNG